MQRKLWGTVYKAGLSLVMGTSRGVNEGDKITISLGIGNLVTLKGAKFEKCTDNL